MKQQLVAIFCATLLCLPGLAIAQDVHQQLHEQLLLRTEAEREQTVAQLELLWRSAIMRSPTLMLGIQKMSEKMDKKKKGKGIDKKGWTENMVQNMIQLGGLGTAAVLKSPYPMVGTSFISPIASPYDVSRDINNVTPTDMVLLAREIDHAQMRLLRSFLDYQKATRDQQQCQRSLDQLQQQSMQLTQEGLEFTDIMQTLVVDRSIACEQANDRRNTVRQVLVLAAGEEAVHQLEAGIPTSTSH